MSWFGDKKDSIMAKLMPDTKTMVKMAGLDDPEKVNELVKKYYPVVEPKILDFVNKHEAEAGGKLKIIIDCKDEILRLQIVKVLPDGKHELYKVYTSENALQGILLFLEKTPLISPNFYDETD